MILSQIGVILKHKIRPTCFFLKPRFVNKVAISHQSHNFVKFLMSLQKSTVYNKTVSYYEIQFPLAKLN